MQFSKHLPEGLSGYTLECTHFPHGRFMLSSKLSAALSPRSVAVIGASSNPGSRGYYVWRSVLLSTGLERLWAVNPKYRFIGERPCFADASRIPADKIDLAILCVGRKHLPAALRQLAEKPPEAVLFAPQEEGPLSDRFEIEELLESASAMGARLIGPNSIGILNPAKGINASFWPRMPQPGGIALITQSAMVATGLMDHAEESRLGFAGIINTGLEADISMAECIEWFSANAAARVIAIEVEALRNPRAFACAVRKASQTKPVIVLRAGPGSGYAADRLAAGRFGTDAGDDRAFDALLAASGALRVRSYEEFCAAAAAFSSGTLPAGRSAAIIANDSGVAALAADAADSAGILIRGLSNRTIQALHKAHPEEHIPVNPVVLGASAPGERFAGTLSMVLDDPGIHGAAVVVGPSPVSTLDPTLSEIARAAMKTYKPVFVSWISSRSTPVVRRQLAAFPDSRIIPVRTPELAMRAFGLLAEREDLIRERRSPPQHGRSSLKKEKLDGIRTLFEHVLHSGRHVLGPREVRELISALGLLPVPAKLTTSLAQAIDAAKGIGWPVAIKAVSEGLGSRSASGLVFLSISGPDELAQAWEKLTANLEDFSPLARPEGVLVEKMASHSLERELRLSIRLDAVLGPVVEFGGAGLASSLYGDRAVGLPPISRLAAERIARAPKAALALGDYRGLPEINWETLFGAICRLSDLAAAVPALRELRLEPVVPVPEGLLVLDAEAALYDAPLAADRSFSHLALQPAQWELLRPIELRSGRTLYLRALIEDDFPLLKDFIHELSETSRYYRFHTNAALSDERIAELSRPDWSAGGAWVLAESPDKSARIAACGRWSALAEDEAEFGICVRDDMHRLGIARRLLLWLESEAFLEGFHKMTGYVLRGNEPMESFMRSSGYEAAPAPAVFPTVAWSKTLRNS